MSVRVTISDGPVRAAIAEQPLAASGGHGAALTFDGVVRPLEDGRELLALEYEVYEPMASSQLGAIAQEVLAGHALFALHVWHSRGLVPVGEASLRVVIFAAHRHEALAAMVAFLDRLKADVPIWKNPVFRDGPAPKA